ncbi:MAG: apolipoprotein N-acyltransferase [Cyanobacteriota bacterium]|nr:apolipoprotein N-acyltransferase [Cyanobacteriota bacterium]
MRIPHPKGSLALAGLAVVLLVLGSPNRWLHLYPAALIGISPLLLLSWNLPFWSQVRWSFGVWFIFCAFVFLPDLFSVKVLEAWEILGGIAIAPIVPLFYVTATVLSLALTRVVPLWIRPLAIATVWTGLDGILGLVWFPIPFHWGSLLYDWPLGIQIADLTGIWGVTFVAVLMNATLAALATLMRQRRNGFRDPRVWRAQIAMTGGVGLGVWSLVLGYGLIRLDMYSHLTDPFFMVAAVQPVAWFDAASPYTQEYRTQRYQELLALSQKGVEQGAELIIWPEGALRGRLQNTPLEPYLLAGLKQILPPTGAWITGAAEPDPRDVHAPDQSKKFNNSALLYDATGQFQDRYGKQWLFPYFETQRYIPPPDSYRPLKGDRFGQLGLMICLESVLPNASRNLVDAGAQLLIAISDDIWFGNSNWPHLHGILSVFRAIENRRSFVFVNNTGGNLIVDPSGRIQQQGEIFQQGVVVGKIFVREEITVYQIWGDYLIRVTGLITLCLGFIALTNRRTYGLD